MTMSAPRLSVFTFESTIHSSHVLRRLDEQRHHDALCDVTVVVEGQSFRAHRCVLAACSEYFAHRVSSLAPQGAVITLPQEVTVTGFEPLLKFAYSSKLLFRKDDVVDIRNSAAILGFRDLDEACFDFLLPKFFSSSKGSVPFLFRKTCCKKKCKRRLSRDEPVAVSNDVTFDEKEVKPVADSSPGREVVWLCDKPVHSKVEGENSTGTLAPAAGWANDHFVQCPKYRRQLACEKEICDKSQSGAATVVKDCCSPFSSLCGKSGDVTKIEQPGNSTSNPSKESEEEAEACGSKADVDVIKKETTEKQETWIGQGIHLDKEQDVGFTNNVTAKPASSWSSSAQGEGSSGLILHHCPPKTSGEDPAVSGSLVHERLVMDTTEDKRIRSYGKPTPVSIHQKAEELVEEVGKEWKRTDEEVHSCWREGGKEEPPASMEENIDEERSMVEREVAEHLAKRLGTDVCFSQLSFQDPDAGSSSSTGDGKAPSTSLEWLDFRINHRSARAGCPFFQDLDQGKCLWKGVELSACEGASQSGVSSLTSGEDGEDGDSETETEGDSESSTRERARQVHLPFSVDWVVDLSRNDFQQLLKQHVFTREQLEFVHDMRRRSKNRLAAQRCRKRKLDCIYNLQCEITKLKAEREKLIMEKSQLGQLKLKTCHSVSALCQRVCSEANLQPEQLQVLAKYTSPDCPLSSVFPNINSLLSQHGLPPVSQASLSGCCLGLNEFMQPKDVSSTSSSETVAGDQHSI